MLQKLYAATIAHIKWDIIGGPISTMLYDIYDIYALVKREMIVIIIIIVIV